MSTQPQISGATVLTTQQLGYILNGACILGSGGGGPYTVGQQVLKYIGTRPVNLVPASAVPDNYFTAVSAFVGSPDAAANQVLDFSVAATAFNALSKTVNAYFPCVLPGEVGAGNSLIPMAVAADNNIAVIDAAGAPRAIPGFLMVTYAAAGIPASPMILADKNNQVTLSCANAIADPATRGVISGNVFPEDAGIAFWTMNGKTLNTPGVAVTGTTSLALIIGTALANAISSGTDPVKAVRQYLPQPNYLLCTGVIKNSSEATSGGFDFGTVVIKADDRVRRHHLQPEREPHCLQQQLRRAARHGPRLHLLSHHQRPAVLERRPRYPSAGREDRRDRRCSAGRDAQCFHPEPVPHRAGRNRIRGHLRAHRTAERRAHRCLIFAIASGHYVPGGMSHQRCNNVRFPSDISRVCGMYSVEFHKLLAVRALMMAFPFALPTTLGSFSIRYASIAG